MNDSHPSPLMELYMRDVLQMEAPYIFHRWALFSAVASFLGRDVCIDYAGQPLYPNLYVLLVGEPASKKSSTLTRARNLMTSAGFNAWGRDSIKRRNLINDLKDGRHMRDLTFTAPVQQPVQAMNAMASILPIEMQQSVAMQRTADEIKKSEIDALSAIMQDDPDKYAHMTICTGELVDLIGKHNTAVLHTLNNIFDCPPTYTDEIGAIQSPYIVLMAAINPTGFETIFNAETLKQGLLTRMLLVHARPSDRKCSAFRMREVHTHDSHIIEQFRRIKDLKGEFYIDDKAIDLFATINRRLPPVRDYRFLLFRQRRELILAKMAMCNSAMRGNDMKITVRDVLYCNTLLTYTEHFMPDALGSFAVDDYSRKMLHILDIFKRETGALTLQELIARTSAGTVVISSEELQNMIARLIQSEQIVGVGNTADSNRPQYAYKEQTLAQYAALDRVTIMTDWLEDWYDG